MSRYWKSPLRMRRAVARAGIIICGWVGFALLWEHCGKLRHVLFFKKFSLTVNKRMISIFLKSTVGAPKVWFRLKSYERQRASQPIKLSMGGNTVYILGKTVYIRNIDPSLIGYTKFSRTCALATPRQPSGCCRGRRRTWRTRRASWWACAGPATAAARAAGARSARSRPPSARPRPWTAAPAPARSGRSCGDAQRLINIHTNLHCLFGVVTLVVIMLVSDYVASGSIPWSGQ